MTNPHEDPGHRPPPPRQGEQPRYSGGYGPPPAGGWQQGPAGSAQAPPYAPAPRTGKGFFGALFDLDFNEMVTARLIKIIYVLIIAVDSLTAILGLILAWSFFEWNVPLGFITLIATPIVWLFGLLMARMSLEFVINQFKITEHLKALREGRR